MREVLADVERWRAAGKRITLATVVSVVGSAPRGVGATLAVSEDGEISGSVSGGCVEPAVIEEGLYAIRNGRPKLLTFGITEEQNVEQIGLSCGGEIRVFVERLEPPTDELLRAFSSEEPVAQVIMLDASVSGNFGKKLIVRGDGALAGTMGDVALDAAAAAVAASLLHQGESGTRMLSQEAHPVEVFIGAYPPQQSLIIIGAGHISIPLSRLAKVLGYRVTVIDAREAFATHERLPEADELLVEWPDEALERLKITSATAVAVLTHDDKFDVPALRSALTRDAGYVGAIGSRGTRSKRDERLREAGVTEEQIARIHGPIGLDIGAQTPEEIALAILAEITAARHGRLPVAR